MTGDPAAILAALVASYVTVPIHGQPFVSHDRQPSDRQHALWLEALAAVGCGSCERGWLTDSWPTGVGWGGEVLWETRKVRCDCNKEAAATGKVAAAVTEPSDEPAFPF